MELEQDKKKPVVRLQYMKKKNLDRYPEYTLAIKIKQFA